MKRHVISAGSITYAIKGRDALRKTGYDAYIERKTNNTGSNGCGYVIIVEGSTQRIMNILKNAGVKILDVNYK